MTKFIENIKEKITKLVEESIVMVTPPVKSTIKLYEITDDIFNTIKYCVQISPSSYLKLEDYGMISSYLKESNFINEKGELKIKKSTVDNSYEVVYSKDFKYMFTFGVVTDKVLSLSINDDSNANDIMNKLEEIKRQLKYFKSLAKDNLAEKQRKEKFEQEQKEILERL